MKKLFTAVLLLAGIGFWACQKEFSYENTNDVTSTGAWEFKDSANTTYGGNPIDYYIDDTSNPSSAFMQYSGLTANQRGSLSISVSFPTGTAATGTYTSILGQVDFNYSFGNGNSYRAESGTQFSTENITVIISQITDTSVTGTFSGVALDSLNKLKVVKDGKFTYKKRAVAATPTTPVSTGTLGTSTDSCTGAIVSGTYKKGVAMTSANTVTVSANVTAIGSYTIYSDTLKGIYFRGTSNFTTTGTQAVVIAASGTPTDSGTVRFRIRYGTSSCTFGVKIDTGSAVVVVPPTGDYLPLTTNSNWTYDFYDNTRTYQDSVFFLSTGTTRNIGSNAFNDLVEPSFIDTNLYRKANGTYYEALDLSDIYSGGGRQPSRILIESTAVNGTWTDTYSFDLNGIPASGMATYTVVGKPATASVVTTGGTRTYTDVIQVRGVYALTISPALPFTTVRTRTSWYAKGVGLIYLESVNNVLRDTVDQRLRRHQIY